MSRILVLEEHLDTREMLEGVISGEGHQVLFASTPEEALALQNAWEVSLVIVDANQAGLEALRLFRDTYPKLELVAMAGKPRRTKAFAKALELGVCRLLPKPLNRQEIRNLLTETVPPFGLSSGRQLTAD